MKKIIVLILVVFTISCTQGIFEVLDYNNILPLTGVPRVHSFIEENRIIIEWDRDEGADSYCLYRDLNPEGPFASLVYEGTGLSCVDDDTDDGRLYYYKLAKVKGTREFEKSAYVMGAGSAARQDEYEDNDTCDNAKVFIDFAQANIYYFRDPYGNTLIDRDWYKVYVPARRMLTLEIEAEDIFDDSEQQESSEEENKDETGLEFAIEGTSPQSFYSLEPLVISNQEYQPAIIRFCIIINEAIFLDEGDFGGRMEFYNIQYVQTDNL